MLLLLTTQVSFSAPDFYLFLGKNPAKNYKQLLLNKNIKGAQIVYSWRELEPQKNVYNFKPIMKDLAFLQSIHKSLFVQIQDRSFYPKVIPVPTYLLSKKYDGGIAKQVNIQGERMPLTIGWVAKQWVPAVQKRFQKLLIALGKQFDGKIKGINLPETAIDINMKKQHRYFTCNNYFKTTIKNMAVLRSAFHKSDVVQYINFFPCEWNNDHHYTSRLFSFAKKNHIGLGGPDVVPYRKQQMNDSYPFFHRYKNKLPLIAFAIQGGDYTYINPKTHRHFTPAEFYDFAKNYLGATILFWNVREPQFTKHVLPLINKNARLP